MGELSKQFIIDKIKINIFFNNKSVENIDVLTSDSKAI
jgi:hypothetical protein